MIKIMLLVSRKDGVSPEEFREHYETTHAPLAAKHLPFLVRYVRNYAVDRFGGDIDCDCVTEFWFDHPGPWREARTKILRQEILDLFAADEEQFMDRTSMRTLVVEEGETEAADLQGVREEEGLSPRGA
jgi:uncharacterized protein (TIGR02118 family)